MVEKDNFVSEGNGRKYGVIFSFYRLKKGRKRSVKGVCVLPLFRDFSAMQKIAMPAVPDGDN